MTDFDDPLDLLDDDGDGVIEMCTLLDEEKKRRKNNRDNNSGCCVVLFVFGASLCLSVLGIGGLN